MLMIFAKLVLLFHFADALLSDRNRQFAVPFSLAINIEPSDGLEKAGHVHLAHSLEGGQVVGEDPCRIGKPMHDGDGDYTARPA